MNLREGSRRLAVFVGVLGTLIACFFSGLVIVEMSNQYHAFNEFSRLTSLNVVKEKSASRRLAQSKSPTGWTLDNDEVIDRDGVHRIVWSSDGKIESIESTGGEPVHSQNEGAWFGEGLAVVGFPVLGFILPWSAVRALAWVVAGFRKE